jgi:hypothetical protein
MGRRWTINIKIQIETDFFDNDDWVRIWLLIKVVRICNRWPTDSPRLQSEPQWLHSPSQNLNFDFDTY